MEEQFIMSKILNIRQVFSVHFELSIASTAHEMKISTRRTDYFCILSKSRLISVSLCRIKSLIHLFQTTSKVERQFSSQ